MHFWPGYLNTQNSKFQYALTSGLGLLICGLQTTHIWAFTLPNRHKGVVACTCRYGSIQGKGLLR